MSRIERWLAGCAGKDPFASFEQALATISERLRRLVRPYHCPSCGQYHVGSVEHTRGKRLTKQKGRHDAADD